MGEVLPELLGHGHILRELSAALDEDRLHHALLFEGPDGTGRRLVATRLAAFAACEGPAPRPCGRCDACRRVFAGTHPDVITVVPDADSASGQIGIDRIRDVVRVAALHRYSAPRRFFLLDPAEALPAPAANALLKTLEEPNPGTHFVLLTRQAQGLLPTIVSRCQRVRFGPVPEAEIATWLRARGLPDPEAAARLGGGAPGRALAWAEGELAERRTLRDALLEALAGDLEGLLKFAEACAEGGRAASRGTVQAVLGLIEDLLRDATLTAAGRGEAILDLEAGEVSQAWATALWPGGVQTCAGYLTDARASLRVNVAPRAVLEALFARMATELGPARRAKVRPAGQ